MLCSMPQKGEQTVRYNVESVEKIYFGIRKILEPIYDQNSKNNSKVMAEV